MVSSIGSNRLESSLQRSLRRNRLIIRILLVNVLFGLIIMLNPAIIASTMRWLMQAEQEPNCADKVKFDLTFLVDQSGSFAKRGQSYNIEVEGIIRAARDQTIIPRDGSVSVSVLTFNSKTVVSVPKRLIKSDCDAEEFARDVENLKCASIDIQQTAPCPFGSTFYTEAINRANINLRSLDNNQSLDRSIHRVILMSTDGQQPDDLKAASEKAAKVRDDAIRDGIIMELDVILMRLDLESDDICENTRNVESIVFPTPDDGLPGAVLSLNGSDCNNPDTNPNASEFNQQADNFAAKVREVLRSHVPHINLIVNTDEDPLDGASSEIGSGKLSLRRAIELANCRQGAATITFAEEIQNKTIRLNAPLPALAAPDITIDGCRGENCIASITIEGSKFRNKPIGEDQSDGILIRSNHNDVRGLKIVDFRRAGIAIAPILQTDSIGHNLIESNTIERTGKAGILILDSVQAQFSSCSVSVKAHNVGNTISRNTILQESPLPGEPPRALALIDLGGDGPTPNDKDDLDEGSNTLLNFPEPLTIDVQPESNTSGSNVVAAAAIVTISGQIAGPAAANATVEIFGITTLNTNDCNLAVEGVTFLAETTTDANGAFSIGQVPMSPTGAFTATITDAAGNTSELTSGCLSPKRVKVILEDSSSTIKFNAVGVAAQEVQNPQVRKFTIQNVGCSPLTLTLNVKRIDDRICQNKKGDCLNDTKLFPISIIANDGREEPVFSDNGQSTPITIQQGKCQDFRVRFKPVIPSVRKAKKAAKKLFAKDVLPSKIKSQIIIESDGLSEIETTFKLINCEQGEQTPVVTLERSGNEFIVMLFIYDSNRNVGLARFEFLDDKGNVVKDPGDVNLSQAKGNPIPGQSFAVDQRFSDASEHPEVRTVRVTIEGGEPVTSKPGVFPTCVAKFRKL
jgi:hypothetical protein